MADKGAGIRRVGIVGAGPGGLAAAMLLAAAGADVTIHERLERVGGRSGTIPAPSPAGLFRFDMGPTFFLYPRVLRDVFAACGANLDDEIELMRLDPQYRLVFETGGKIDATSDMARMQAEIARFAPADAENFEKFMTANRRKLAAIRPALERPFSSVLDLLAPPVLRALPFLRPTSVDTELGRYFADPNVRLAFSFQSKYLGMSPFRCPSLFTILSFMEYEYGVWHPRGGCGAVMDAMARVARRLGVAVRLGQPVQRIAFEGRRAVGLHVANERLDYDAIVINADFGNAMRTLVPDTLRRRWTDRKISSKKFSCSTFMLYLGIEGTLPDLAHHTVFLAKDYRRNVAEIEAGRAPPGEPSFYVQNACVTDASLAPPDHSTLYVLVPVGHNGERTVDWAAECARYRELALDRLEKIGVPDIRGRIRYEKILTPQGWEDDMAIHLGATFNLAHNIGQMLFMRPHNRFEDLDRVYLVGGGTHPGSGLPVIFESARITSKLLAEDLGLKPTWDTAMAPEAPMVPHRELEIAE
jgi:phytoene desaturase